MTDTITNIRAITLSDLRAPTGRFRAVVLIDSEYYQIGEDARDAFGAYVLCIDNARNQSYQVYNDAGEELISPHGRLKSEVGAVAPPERFHTDEDRKLWEYAAVNACAGILYTSRTKYEEGDPRSLMDIFREERRNHQKRAAASFEELMHTSPTYDPDD